VVTKSDQSCPAACTRKGWWSMQDYSTTMPRPAPGSKFNSLTQLEPDWQVVTLARYFLFELVKQIPFTGDCPELFSRLERLSLGARPAL